MAFRTYFRLILGAFCIILAVGIALYDFMKGVTPVNKGQTLEAQRIFEEEEEPALEEDQEEEENTSAIEACPVDETLQILKGDTLSSVLSRAKFDMNQVHDLVDALKKVFNPKDLRPDHEIIVTYIPLRKNKEKIRDLTKLSIRPSIDIEVVVQRNEKGVYEGKTQRKKLEHTVEVAKGEIQDSLYLDAGKQGVPAKILHDMIKAFSYDVDFQRSFHPGDGYGLVYDSYMDPETMREESGELAFAYLRLKDRELRLYRFKPDNGSFGYYDEKGESVRKGLLRTPIDGARISSGFGTRRHPVLGYSKHHKGVDFAAPTGTPIMAAGDGVVDRIGPWGAYGNYVRIRHNSELSTAYAHLSRYAKGLSGGRSVKQGQVIGYVGSTGRTTGAHLHYELIVKGKQIDPKHVRMMPAGKLTGKDLKAFKALVAKLDTQFKNYTPVTDKEEEDNSPDVIISSTAESEKSSSVKG